MTTPFRRTKIVASLGPASDDREVLRKMIQFGLNVVRINFSHGSNEDHIRRIKKVRNLTLESNRAIAIIGDLQGHKIRIGRFTDGSINLEEGAPFIIDAQHPRDQGNQERVWVGYPELCRDVHAKDTLLLDDGNIELVVTKVDGTEIHTEVVVGGKLSDNKGVNKRGGGLSAEALTDKDRHDIKLAAQLGVDYLAVSFVRNAQDVLIAKQLLVEAGLRAGIIAKIERREALLNIGEITDAADALMIARGDLGVEIGDADLPGVQKSLIKEAYAKNKMVITATQMMESMITNMHPTRAEVLDVANAVLDGTDAVMLSAETAVGKHPHLVIKTVDNICRGSEKHINEQSTMERIRNLTTVEDAIASATMYIANRHKVVAILALTESGRTAHKMSRNSGKIPIYAITPHETTSRRVALTRGVVPLCFDPGVSGHATKIAVDKLKDSGALRDEDTIIVTQGTYTGVSGGTNSMEILRVSDLG